MNLENYGRIIDRSEESAFEIILPKVGLANFDFHYLMLLFFNLR